MNRQPLRILVLRGGPDRERPVSFKSGFCVAQALQTMGHQVIERDITPDDTSALQLSVDVIFPVLHGPFGEGGPLQELLEKTAIPYVGSGPQAGRIAIDKIRCKQVVAEAGVTVAESQIITVGQPLTPAPPLVIKPINDGSSFGVCICHTPQQVEQAKTQLHHEHDRLMAETWIDGPEITVGVLDGKPLPVIQIVPHDTFYDYHAKYDSNRTEYRFDTDLTDHQLQQARQQAIVAYQAVGCRHLARVDFMVDAQRGPVFLEINTMPGFTDHSLLPKAAAKAGYPMALLCDHLIQLALAS